MNWPTENETDEQARARRSQWPVRKGKLGEAEFDISQATTPEERLAMVWPLTVQAFAFQGVDVAESRLPRHLIRVARRER